MTPNSTVPNDATDLWLRLWETERGLYILADTLDAGRCDRARELVQDMMTTFERLLRLAGKKPHRRPHAHAGKTSDTLALLPLP